MVLRSSSLLLCLFAASLSAPLAHTQDMGYYTGMSCFRLIRLARAICVAVCCSLLQSVAVCCNLLQCPDTLMMHHADTPQQLTPHSALHSVAVYCRLLDIMFHKPPILTRFPTASKQIEQEEVDHAPAKQMSHQMQLLRSPLGERRTTRGHDPQDMTPLSSD